MRPRHRNDTVTEVPSDARQGSGCGCPDARRPDAVLATASTAQWSWAAATWWLGGLSTRARRGAGTRWPSRGGVPPGRHPGLVRFNSMFYGFPAVARSLTAGTEVSVTVRMDPAVKEVIDTIEKKAGVGIKYPQRSTTRPPASGSRRPKSSLFRCRWLRWMIRRPRRGPPRLPRRLSRCLPASSCAAPGRGRVLRRRRRGSQGRRRSWP
jgi:hypothetical protein